MRRTCEPSQYSPARWGTGHRPGQIAHALGQQGQCLGPGQQLQSRIAQQAAREQRLGPRQRERVDQLVQLQQRVVPPHLVRAAGAVPQQVPVAREQDAAFLCARRTSMASSSAWSQEVS